MEPLARHRTDRTKNLVGFLVGDVRYAVDILRVREIVNPLVTVALPHPPPGVVGVADHRGEVVPILDLRLRFALTQTPPTRRTKWIIVSRADKSVGLVVDAVTDVFGTGEPDQRSVPELGVGDAARGIAAVYSHDGTLVFVLDVDRIVALTESLDMRALEGLVSKQPPARSERAGRERA